MNVTKKYLKHIEFDLHAAIASLDDHQRVLNAFEWVETDEGDDFWEEVFSEGWSQEALNSMMIMILVKLMAKAKKIEKEFS